MNFIGERARDGLDLHGRGACTQRVIFKGDGRAEQRHQPVARELVDSAAVALYHCRGPIEQLVHDFAESFGFQRGSETHRLHHIGEEDGDLLTLEGCLRRSYR